MAGGVDLDWLCGVVARHAPAFFLHPADRFMPCTAEFFLQHSELRAEVDGRSALLLPQGSVAAPLLLEAQRAVPPGCRLWLNLDPAARRGMPQVGCWLLAGPPMPAAQVVPLGRSSPAFLSPIALCIFPPCRAGGAG